MSTSNINVKVMGKSLTIAAPDEEKLSLQQAVALLNEKIETIRNQGKITDSDKIIVLAALNLTHDFLKLKGDNGLDFTAFEQQINTALASCQSILSQ